MQTLRKLVLVLAMIYFLFLVLVITNLVSVDFLDRQLTNFNRDNFFKTMMLIGAGLLALALAVEQAHAAFLQRRIGKLEAGLQQLKATSYDAQQRVIADALSSVTPVTPPTGGVVVPPASALPGELR